MSQSVAQYLLESRGTHRTLEAFVVAVCFDRAGSTVAFALGDGTLRLVALAERDTWNTVEAHDGAVLSLAPDASRTGFISGGDDGKFLRIDQALADFRGKWVEHVASHPGEKGKGALIACTVGKAIHLFSGTGEKLKELPHPSTVTGLTFDARGKRIAASHYNGASLWFVNAKEDSPRRLEWKGSHTAIVIHPEGDAVVTAMQENALHGWRLSDNQHMRMSGYPAKTEALSFTRNGKWLATSGADSMVLWPFFGGGPMGKAPIELAGGDGVTCTRVAAHPQQEMVAGGFADGLVVLAEVNSSRILPIAPPGQGRVSALAWSPDGSQLAIGTEKGFAAIIDLSKR
jgi:WD40 repeat protein